MTANPYSPPKAKVADSLEEEAPPIWNPNAAANWSLIFSPAFGAFLQMRNWRALGEDAKAASAKGWFIASLAVLAVYIVLGLAVRDPRAADGASRTLALVYLIVWYFSAGRSQAKYVKEKFGAAYPRRGWAKPLLIGVLAFVGYVALAFVIGILVGVARRA